MVDASTNRRQLCDFGCSAVFRQSQEEEEEEEDYDYEDYKEDGYETYIMSRFYRAPEMILGNRHYELSADIWSLGVVFSELFLGTILFMGSSNKDQLREIILKLGWPSESDLKDMQPSTEPFDRIEGVYGVEPTEQGESWSMIFMGVFGMEEAAMECVSELLVYSPDERLTALECLNHEYFDEVKALMNKSRKGAKKGKKLKKVSVVPLDLFDWNDDEVLYAKSKKEELRR